jgi:tetratricopeptide (TPR) repeat protein
MHRKLLVLVAAACGAVGLAPMAAADTITMVKNNNQIRGVEILQARWDFVQYKVGNRTVSANGADVFAIERDSLVLRPLRRALKASDYPRAVSEADKVMKGPSQNAWEKLEAAYSKGEALLESGQYKEAAAAFQEYLDAAKDTKDWYEPYAIYGLGKAALEQRLSKTAQNHFKELNAYGSRWMSKAALGMGEAFLGANDPVKARQLFNQVRQDRGVSPILKQQADAGYAKALVLQKQYTQAIRELEQEFFRVAPRPGEAIYTRARAEATFLMGEAYMGQEGKENLEQAEIWYLKTVALYRHYTELYREACKRLQEVYGKLGNDERAKEWRSRLAAASGS